jgi:hypothetical protein
MKKKFTDFFFRFLFESPTSHVGHISAKEVDIKQNNFFFLFKRQISGLRETLPRTLSIILCALWYFFSSVVNSAQQLPVSVIFLSFLFFF